MTVPVSAGTIDHDYDPVTLARIDHATARPRSRVEVARGWRGRSAAGALAAGLVLGLHDVFHGRAPDEIIEEIDVSGLDAGKAVTLLFVPGEPKRSIAWVRPWLLG